MNYNWKYIDDKDIEFQYASDITIEMLRPPKLPVVKQMIEALDTPEKKQVMIIDLLMLWYLINARSRGADEPPEPFRKWNTYYFLKQRYPDAAKCMWEYISERMAKAKREYEARRFTDAERKLRKVKTISVKVLEHIHSVRGEEFFRQPARFNTLQPTYNWQDKQSIERQLTILWYIVLHIGPGRRVKKSLGGEDTVYYLLYQRLRRRHKTMHKRMIEYINKHPETVPPIPEKPDSD